jgi:hypothetical protein
MSVAKYLYDEGCKRTTFQDHCEFEVIDIKVTEVSKSQSEAHNRV